MSTADVALYQWFSQFGTFYPSTAVPDDVGFPYGTYQMVFGEFGDVKASSTVHWYEYTESELKPNNKVRQIANAIGRGGVQIPVDGGCIWITKGTPFANAIVDQSDTTIKVRVMNLTFEYITYE